MRDVKFRIYDKEHKIFIYTHNQPHLDSEYSDLCFPAKTKKDRELLDNCCSIDLEVNQYTGLKDKNGVEIYEGDIVQCKWEGLEEPEIVLGNIYWAKGASAFAIDSGEIAEFGLEGISSFGTVLGNIYENPELLKDTNESDKI